MCPSTLPNPGMEGRNRSLLLRIHYCYRSSCLVPRAPALGECLSTANVAGALTPNRTAQLLHQAGTQTPTLGFKLCSFAIGQEERHRAEEANKIRYFIPSSIDHFSRSVFALDCKIKLQRLPEQINGQTHPNNTKHLQARFIPERYSHPHLGISHNQGESP